MNQSPQPTPSEISVVIGRIERGFEEMNEALSEVTASLTDRMQLADKEAHAA